MANTITKTTILDGANKVIFGIDIIGDGSGDETGTVVVDFSALGGGRTDWCIQKIIWEIYGFSAVLLWDATTDVVACTLPEGNGGYDYSQAGGPIINRAGTGKTGDLLITTVGLVATGRASIRIEGKKRG